MIQYTTQSQISNQLFKTPFDNELDQNNRWVLLRDRLPWDEMVKPLFNEMNSDQGRPTIDLRYVLGALIIQSIENLTDETTISTIQENIYMQYFIGLPNFTTKEVFTPELFVTIRKRLGGQGVGRINTILLSFLLDNGVIKHRKVYEKKSPKEKVGSISEDEGKDENNKEDKESDTQGSTGEQAVENRGTLKVDATVAPQWIKYPMDTDLLNDCRLASEQIIDLLWAEESYGDTKPRTYRRNLKDQFLNFKKTKSPGKRKIRKMTKSLLNALRRNISHINKGLDGHAKGLELLSHKQYRNFLVMQCVYDQQQEMFREKKNQVADRIVSLHQPWVRPMVRGKAGKKTEFGAQINMSESEGYVTFDQIDYNKFNEALGLEEQIEDYKKLNGYYPAAVLVDKIYLTRSNRNFMKDRGIAHYGAPLGRPPKMDKEEKKKRAKKQNKRAIIEGKIGQAKTKFGLDKIKTRLQPTSMAKIQLVALGLNIWRYLKHLINHSLDLFFSLFTAYVRLYKRLSIDYYNATTNHYQFTSN